MSRPVKNERHAERPPDVQPFTEQTLGSLDSSAYTVHDVATDLRDYGYGGSEPSPGGAVGGAAGASSTTAGLGMASLGGIWVGPQHAQRPVPIEYSGGLTAPHAGPRANDYGETY